MLRNRLDRSITIFERSIDMSNQETNETRRCHLCNLFFLTYSSYHPSPKCLLYSACRRPQSNGQYVHKISKTSSFRFTKKKQTIQYHLNSSTIGNNSFATGTTRTYTIIQLKNKRLMNRNHLINHYSSLPIDLLALSNQATKERKNEICCHYYFRC